VGPTCSEQTFQKMTQLKRKVAVEKNQDADVSRKMRSMRGCGTVAATRPPAKQAPTERQSAIRGRKWGPRMPLNPGGPLPAALLPKGMLRSEDGAHVADGGVCPGGPGMRGGVGGVLSFQGKSLRGM